MAKERWTQEKLNRLHECYELGMDDSEIAGVVGRSVWSVRHKRGRLNLPGGPDRQGAHLRGKHPTFSDQARANMSASKRIWAEKNATGVSLKPSGYIEITRGPNKARSAHRVIMENHLGRPLLHEEIVHHKDENKTNNSIGNLEIMTPSQHTSHHARKRFADCQRSTQGRFL